MITKQQALTRPSCLYHISLHNADGTPLRCRSAGKCQTWVRKPEEFVLPVKYGIKGYFRITLANASEWQLERPQNALVISKKKSLISIGGK